MDKRQNSNGGSVQRIVLCVYPGLYPALLLRELLHSPETSIAGIVCSTRILKKNNGYFRGVTENLAESGFRYLAFQAWSTDLFHMLQPVSRVKSILVQARRHHIPVIKTRDINAPDAVAFVRSLDPDVILTGYFNQLVKPEIMSLATLGCLNVHPSHLPLYRGTDPVFRAMENNEAEIGITVHRLAETFDTGHVMAHDRIPLDLQHSALHYYALTFQRAARLVLAAIRGLAAGEPGEPQTAGGSYHSWPSAGEVTDFQRSGKRLTSLRDYRRILRAAAGDL